tara:strand:+ start:455 stop:874 length:420 start_codon:yes stop_codon:yes gene_type:complete
LAVFTAFNILANYKFPLNEALCFTGGLSLTQSVLQAIWPAVALALFPISMVYLYLANQIIAKLKSEHPEVYSELGNISLIKNNTIANSSKFCSFLFKAKYKPLNNGELTKLAEPARYLLVSGIALAVIAFLLPIAVGYM